jgi:hypothetical protein
MNQWIVTAATAEVLRGTGVMYRHLAFRPEENFTTADAEAHAQRNAALAHVEKHRLSGVVHFADAAGVYDAHFFDEIRQIESVHPSIHPIWFLTFLFSCLITRSILSSFIDCKLECVLIRMLLD